MHLQRMFGMTGRTAALPRLGEEPQRAVRSSWLFLRRHLSGQVQFRFFSFQFSLPSIIVRNGVLSQHIRSLENNPQV